MFFKLKAAALALLLVSGAASATLCDLTAGKDQSCTINGAIYSNPTNLTNIGSGNDLPVPDHAGQRQRIGLHHRRADAEPATAG